MHTTEISLKNVTAAVWCVPFSGTVGLFNKLQTQKVPPPRPPAPPAPQKTALDWLDVNVTSSSARAQARDKALRRAWRPCDQAVASTQRLRLPDDAVSRDRTRGRLKAV